jgi:glycosyltransferase involved in cell wall biosynthesis
VSDVKQGVKALYITLDGLTDPLGRSQVLPYLVGLAARGHAITILSSEKPHRFATGSAAVQAICDSAGIRWAPVPYRNRPPIIAHARTISALVRTAFRLDAREGFDLVHCRSYPPALAGLLLKRRRGVPLLFDMRGFFADEKIEGGGWALSNPAYRTVYGLLKRLESALFASADRVISLTDAGKAKMLERPEFGGADERITVIPCCVDFDHFPLASPEARSAARAELGIPPDAHLLAYLGSLGSWYMGDEMLDFFRAYLRRHEDARFLFVTPDPEERIKAAAVARGVPPERIVVRFASREQVPALVGAADLGLFFIRPVPSKVASSPTKMGEMLALGLPIVTNAGVGDVDGIIAAVGCGAVVDGFDEASYVKAITAVEACRMAPEEIRRRSLPLFDAEEGVARYDSVYRSIAGRGRHSSSSSSQVDAGPAAGAAL